MGYRFYQSISIKGAHVAPSTGIKPRPTVVGAPTTPSARRSSLDVPPARYEGPLRFTRERREPIEDAGVSPWESIGQKGMNH